MLRSSDFRKVYQEGVRMSGPYFAAFCLAVSRAEEEGPRLGFTLSRKFGGSVSRNRAKRRLREALRMRLADIGHQWDVVINPRRPALEATPEQLRGEVERLVKKCAR